MDVVIIALNGFMLFTVLAEKLFLEIDFKGKKPPSEKIQRWLK